VEEIQFLLSNLSILNSFDVLATISGGYRCRVHTHRWKSDHWEYGHFVFLEAWSIKLIYVGHTLPLEA
jgi:hypothetical protein